MKIRFVGWTAGMLAVGACVALTWQLVGSRFSQGARLFMAADEIDFGVLSAGQRAVRTVTVANRGTSRLEIRSIKSSCGCAAVKMAPRVLEPGQAGQLEISLVGKGIPGEASAFVALTSNDARNPVRIVNARYRDPQKVTVEPSMVDFGRVNRSKLPSTRDIVVKIRDRQLLTELAQLSCQTEESFVESQVLTMPEDELARVVRLRLRDDAPSGEILMNLKLRSPEGGVDTQISVYAKVEGVFFVRPGSVRLTENKEAPVSEVQFRKKMAGAEAPFIEGVALSESIAEQVEIETADPAEDLAIRLRLRRRTPSTEELALTEEVRGFARVKLRYAANASESIDVPVYISGAR